MTNERRILHEILHEMNEAIFARETQSVKNYMKEGCRMTTPHGTN